MIRIQILRKRLTLHSSARLELAKQEGKHEVAVTHNEALALSPLPQAELTQVQQKVNAVFTPRVFIHIRDEAQRDSARRLQEELRAQKYDAPGIEKVNVGPQRPDVRYFLSADAEEAERVAKVFRSFGGANAQPQFIAMAKGHEPPRPRSYEIWYAPPEPVLMPLRPEAVLTSPKLLGPPDKAVFGHFPRSTTLT